MRWDPVNPDAAHEVVNCGSDGDVCFSRVTVEVGCAKISDLFEPVVSYVFRQMFKFQTDGVFSADAEVHVMTDFVDGVGDDVTQHEVAEFGIPFFHKVPAFSVTEGEEASVFAPG